MLTRRAFFAFSGAGVLSLWVADTSGAKTIVAQLVPKEALAPDAIPRFLDPVVVPGAMPRAGRFLDRLRRTCDSYTVSVRQFDQQVLPRGLPTTTLWGYGPANAVGTAQHSAPSMTIEAVHGRPVRVRWSNQLTDAHGAFLPHLLPVDPTLHWANPDQRPGPGGLRGTDLRPDFTGLTYVPPEEFTDATTQYTSYRGPVPLVTHLHGATGVGDESDGYPEAWYLPDARNIPRGFARSGRWYRFFALKAWKDNRSVWGPGSAVSDYPMDNRASTLWFHDHALGMTRVNVYAGPVGFLLVRGGPHGDAEVRDARTGGRATLPGPAPQAGERPGTTHLEIPLAIQDRSFKADGSLFYPDSRAFFDEYDGPLIPESPVSPLWNPEFFGNTLIVNGRTWPYLEVQQRRYRFRFLNGCQSRFLILDFSAIPGVLAWQIGNDGGFMAAPHDVMGAGRGRILLGPAERADVIVDFAGVPHGAHVLRNIGPDEPYGGGEPDDDFDPAHPETTGQVMQFRVRAATSSDRSTPPQHLRLPRIAPLGPEVRVRRVSLNEHSHETAGGDAPVAAVLGLLSADPRQGPVGVEAKMWSDAVTENPASGATEVWEVYNMTVDAHPVHLHAVTFEVLDRRPIEVGEGWVTLSPDAPVLPPEPGESGTKDTVIAYPGEMIRLRARFEGGGQYVWHCHILEHEDNEMMRPIRIGPVQAGQPKDGEPRGGRPWAVLRSWPRSHRVRARRVLFPRR